MKSTILALALFLAPLAAHAQLPFPRPAVECAENYAYLTTVFTLQGHAYLWQVGPQAPLPESWSSTPADPIDQVQRAETVTLWRALFDGMYYGEYRDAHSVTCAQIAQLLQIAAEGGYRSQRAYKTEAQAFWKEWDRLQWLAAGYTFHSGTVPIYFGSSAAYQLRQRTYGGGFSADQIQRQLGVLGF